MEGDRAGGECRLVGQDGAHCQKLTLTLFCAGGRCLVFDMKAPGDTVGEALHWVYTKGVENAPDIAGIQFEAYPSYADTCLRSDQPIPSDFQLRLVDRRFDYVPKLGDLREAGDEQVLAPKEHPSYSQEVSGSSTSCGVEGPAEEGDVDIKLNLFYAEGARMDVLLKGPRCYPVGELLSWVHKNEDLRSDIPAGTLFDAYSDPFTRLQDDQPIPSNLHVWLVAKGLEWAPGLHEFHKGKDNEFLAGPPPAFKWSKATNSSTLVEVPDSELLTWKLSLAKEAERTLKAPAPHEDHTASSGKQAKKWLSNQEASDLQMRCDIAMHVLAKRLDASIQRVAAETSTSPPLDYATRFACATRLQPESIGVIQFDLQPHELECLGELRRGLAKSEVLECAYDHILGRHPCFHTFTPDLQHVERGSPLACQLELDNFYRKQAVRLNYVKLGLWPKQKQQQLREQQLQKQHNWTMPEAQMDCLGACVSSLAFELISLLLQNMASVPLPPECTSNILNSRDQDRLDMPPPDTKSSGTKALRSRLQQKAEQQQRAKKEQQQQQAEAEWLRKVDRAQACHAMYWRDLVAILFYLPGCMKLDARSPRTIWRAIESAHVAACVCRLLGLVFASAENKEPLALKVLACPSAEELAGILAMQVSSLAMQWSMTSMPKEALPSFWLDARIMPAKDYTHDLLRAVEQCWDFALVCWQQARKEKDQAESDGSNAPVVFWGRAVHACAWAAHVLLARSFTISLDHPSRVPRMVAKHYVDISLLRVVVQTLQDLHWEKGQEQAGCVRPSRSRPSSCVAAASAGALLLESVAGKLWLLHGSSGSDEKLVLHEQLLRRANTLAACMRLQLNSTVANFSTKTSEMGSKSKTEAAAEGCSAAAAAAGAHTGVHARHQPSSPQAQAASTNASASGSQAHGVLGSEGSSGGRSSGGDADDVLALRMDVASVFSAACRLVRALHPLLSESQGQTSKTHPPAESETCSALRLLLRQNAKMLAEAICMQLPKFTTVVGLTGLAAADLLQQLLQMALYLKASYGSSEEFVPRMSPHKFGLLLETLSAAELCRPVLVQGNPTSTIAHFLLPRPTLASHLCQLMHYKACTDMQAAVESMERYNVLSNLHVLPKLQLLQQLLPSLTCPVSTNPVSTNPVSNSSYSAGSPIQHDLTLEQEYLGRAGGCMCCVCVCVRSYERRKKTRPA